MAADASDDPNALIEAAKAGDRATLERLVPERPFENQHGAILYLAHHPDEPDGAAAVRLLLECGCPVQDTRQKLDYVTPMHLSCWFGLADIVDVLLEFGHDVNPCDDEYTATPLQWVTYACRTEQKHPKGQYGRLAGMLLDHGATWAADIYPVGDAEVDAVLEPRVKERFDSRVREGTPEEIAGLIEAGVGQEKLDLGLVIAAQFGRAELVPLLMDAGAKVRVVEETRWTAINAAVWSESVETLEALLANGADVHAKNRRGGTVWHALGECGASKEMIDVVVKHGGLPDINKPSKYKYVPLDLAIIEEHDDTIAYMRELGAEPAEEELPE